MVVELSDEERETLQRWARRHTSSQALALRCRIVLGAAEGMANVDIAEKLGCHFATVGKWRNRFAERRLDGLSDEPRPGPPRTIDDAKVEEVVVKTLEETPPDATHWSTRQMAEAVGISASSVSKIWRAFGLKPHRTEDFKVSPDPLFVEKVRDLVGLYLNPRTQPWCYVWITSPRYRPWTAPHRSCRSFPAAPSGSPTTTNATERPTFTPLWTPPPAMSSGR